MSASKGFTWNLTPFEHGRALAILDHAFAARRGIRPMVAAVASCNLVLQLRGETVDDLSDAMCRAMLEALRDAHQQAPSIDRLKSAAMAAHYAWLHDGDLSAAMVRLREAADSESRS